MEPITGQGIITDTSLRAILPEAMKESFEFSDVFLYSHGWWTNAERRWWTTTASRPAWRGSCSAIRSGRVGWQG